MTTAITPPAFGNLPLGESEAIDVLVHSGSNGQVPGNCQPWLVLRFTQDTSPWTSGAPFDMNFAATAGTTYQFVNDAPGIATLKARATSASSIQVQPSERCLVVVLQDPATNTVEFRKVASTVDASVDQVQRARGVITTALAAYTATGGTITANANGAIGAVMDGLTPVAGDIVFLPESVAAAPKDGGPYQVISAGAGGAPFVLTRPGWYKFGSLIPFAFTIRIAAGGAIFGGSDFRSFVTSATKVVDTDAPLFQPSRSYPLVVLASGRVNAAGPTYTPSFGTTGAPVLNGAGDWLINLAETAPAGRTIATATPNSLAGNITISIERQTDTQYRVQVQLGGVANSNVDFSFRIERL